MKDYVRLWTDTGKIMALATMKHIEDQLAGKHFFVRVNKSYIINIKYITEVDGNTIRIKDQSIPIGNTYRTEVYQLLERYKLV